MKKNILISIAIIASWYVNASFGLENNNRVENASQRSASAKANDATNRIKFKCDGREHCSQMTSCEEAKYFIKNCPNTKMDGDNDGIPCEKQWCNGYK